MKQRIQEQKSTPLLTALLLALGATSCGGGKSADATPEAEVPQAAVWDQSNWDEAAWQ